MKKDEKKTSRKKGEEGYWERDTSAAHKAAAPALLEANATFSTAEAFQTAADAYFAECDANGDLYGEAGLCLGLTKYNTKGRLVTLRSLRGWYDGESCPWLQDVVQMAYLRIAEQIERDPRYQEKGGMATRCIFLQKQPRFGGYQDKADSKPESTINIVFGKSAEASDFK